MAAKIDKVERLGDLLALLLATTRPVPVTSIVRQVPGYPSDPESARVQFERDKADLRAEGVDVRTEGVGDEAGYRIDPATYYLPDLGLTEEEAVALNVAAGAVRLEGDDPDEALLKVGAVGADGPALVALPSDQRLPALWEAVRARRPVAFRYGPLDREVEPWGLLCRDAFWYVIGHDRTRGERRTFRVDRIDGAVTAGDDAGAFTVPGSFDAATALSAHAFGLADDEPVEALVEVDRVMAARVVGEVGEGSVRERREDGSVVVALAVRNPEGLRSWLLGLLDHARLLGPAPLVEGVTAWLRAVAVGTR